MGVETKTETGLPEEEEERQRRDFRDLEILAERDPAFVTAFLEQGLKDEEERKRYRQYLSESWTKLEERKRAMLDRIAKEDLKDVAGRDQYSS